MKETKMTKEFTKDKLRTKVYSNRTAMGIAAAGDVVKKMTELFTTHAYVNIIFAAAPSQNEFLAALVESSIDWSRVRAFHMDEYIGLSDEAPQLFGNFLQSKIFGKLPFKAIYYLKSNINASQEECGRYAALLKEYPVDIVCMGIGENGHIAFNDPPVANFKDLQLVKMVELDQSCRQQQVNDGCFTIIDEVPKNAITLTIPALMAAKYIYCIVPGPTKSMAVYNTLNQGIIEQYPSTILRTHGNATLYLDELSSAKLSLRQEL